MNYAMYTYNKITTWKFRVCFEVFVWGDVLKVVWCCCCIVVQEIVVFNIGFGFSVFCFSIYMIIFQRYFFRQCPKNVPEVWTILVRTICLRFWGIWGPTWSYVV